MAVGITPAAMRHLGAVCINGAGGHARRP